MIREILLKFRILNFVKPILSLSSNPIIILILYNSVNLTNLILQMYSSKVLTKSEFSIYYTGIALVSIFLGPFNSVQLFFQKKFIKIFRGNYMRNFNDFFNFSLVLFLLIELIFFFIFIYFQDYLKFYLKIEDRFIFTLLFILHFFSLMLIIPGSILYAKNKYKTLHFTILILDILRVIIFIFLWNYFSNILYFYFILNILYTISSLFCLYKLAKINLQILVNIKNFFRYFKLYFLKIFKYMIYSISWPLLIQLDIIFVKMYFNEKISASYIVVSSIAKIIYFFSNILQYYIFNQMLQKKKNNLFNFVFFITLTFSILILLFFIKESFIIFFYDRSFLLTIDAFIYILISFALISIVNIIFNSFLSLDKFKFLIYFVFSIIFYLFLNSINHHTYLDLAKNLFYVSLLLFFLSSIEFLLRNKFFK
jgi:hypothetical protein